MLPTGARALRGHVTHHRHHHAGDVYGGQQPVVGSHLYMFAINTTGYGSSPISLLNGNGVSYDPSNQGYIVSGADGSFDLTGLYEPTCQLLGITGNSVYLQALGGDPGDGTSNSAIDLVTALPLTCGQEQYAREVGINELTTVAAAWALSRNANAANSSISSNGANPQALLNAVAYANNLVSGYDQQVKATAYDASLTVPVATINTMGDILAECVNNGVSSTACSLLFAYATPNNGTAPTDTFQAAINIALNPTNHVADLFSLVPSIGAPFQPTLTDRPSSWMITYGISTAGSAQWRAITFDHTKVPNSDQINFPLAVSANANPVLRNISSGGMVQSPNGYDILFTSDPDGQNMLDFEIDNYNSATGAASFWVRIPQLSHLTDTTIYMWFGIPSISNSLENALGVWSNNYLSVYHFGSGAALSPMDSGIAGYNLSGTAGTALGIIGGASSFNGDVNQVLYHGNVSAYPNGSNPVTLEAWEQQVDSAGGSDLIGYGDASLGQGINLEQYHVGFGQYFYGDGFVGSYWLPEWGGTSWHLMTGVYGGGNVGPPLTLNYLDGQAYTTGYASGTPNNATTELAIGTFPGLRGCCALTGQVDEVRVSAGARSSDWIATEYNNGSSPTTFGRVSPSLVYSSSLLLSSSVNPSSFGQPISLTAMVIGPTSSGGIIPTGGVTFYDGTSNVGLVAVDATGLATLTTSTLSVGSHSLTAAYSGDGNFSGSTTSPLAEAVTATHVSTMSCVPSAIASGQNVTCSLTLLAGAYSAVSFSLNGSPWSTAIPDASGNVVTNALVSEAASGTYPIAYSYPGDLNIPGSSGVVQIAVNAPGTGPSGSGIYSFSITDQYGNSGYAPNSNINAYSDSVNGMWSMVSAGPGYDSLNRLTYATVTPIAGPSKWACWAYDSFGNMLTQGISTQAFSNPATCQAQEGATTLQNTFSYATNINQITSGTWLDASQNTHTGSPLYDPSGAGYMTSDLINSYLYDAEGNICAMQPGGGGTITGYLYDAEGHRVAKGTLPVMTCDSTQLQLTALYFIGPDNETMTEISSSGWVRTEVSAASQHLATYRPDGIHYPLTDWLGTKRVVVNPNLALNNGIEETCTSFPFGDQLNCATPIDASPTHFTGKERDYESGNDYFGARYYSSITGRWISPDPSNAGVDTYLPQTLNRYNYTVNNPLNLVDRNGTWATYFHVAADVAAFPGLGFSNQYALARIQWDADFGEGQQDPSNAYKHGMSDGGGKKFYGGGNEQHAWEQAETFIDGKVQEAKDAQAKWEAEGHTGIAPAALQAFGQALHLVQDRTSPAHKGEQPWSNKMFPGIQHIVRELYPSLDEASALIKTSQDLFRRTFGRNFEWMLSQQNNGGTVTTSQGPGNLLKNSAKD